jgi:hypothetical protein
VLGSSGGRHSIPEGSRGQYKSPTLRSLVLQAGPLHVRGALTHLLPLPGNSLTMILSDCPSLLLRAKNLRVGPAQWVDREGAPQGNGIQPHSPTASLPFRIEAVHLGGIWSTGDYAPEDSRATNAQQGVKMDIVVVDTEDGPMVPPLPPPQKNKPNLRCLPAKIHVMK